MPGRFNIDLVMTPLPAIVARGYFIAAERMKELREPMTDAARAISREIAANFDAEGRPARWEELADSTVRKKQSEGLDPRILRATTALYDGIVGEGMYGPGSWDIGPDGGEWVAVLEDPTGYGWRHLNAFPHKFMPARDWTFVPDEVSDEVNAIFYDWLNWVVEPIGAA